jgi:phospholipid N-methyltransferase
MAGKSTSGRENQLRLFARNFLKHPKMLGSAIPSSRFLVNHLLSHVDWRRADLVIEFGPGVGTFTRHILERMKPNARLLALELNEDFLAHLGATIDDPRLLLRHASATDVDKLRRRNNLPRADYIVSGIPFSSMPDAVRAATLTATRQALAPDGALLVYQFSGKVLPDLRARFGTVTQAFEPLNILPARLFCCSGAPPAAAAKPAARNGGRAGAPSRAQPLSPRRTRKRG